MENGTTEKKKVTIPETKASFWHIRTNRVDKAFYEVLWKMNEQEIREYLRKEGIEEESLESSVKEVFEDMLNDMRKDGSYQKMIMAYYAKNDQTAAASAKGF